MIRHETTDGVVGEAALAEALTSDSRPIRIMARGAASAWMNGFMDWANDELNRPKADPVDVMQAVAALQIQTFASLVAQLVEPVGDQAVVELYAETVLKRMAEHIAHTRQQIGETA